MGVVQCIFDPVVLRDPAIGADVLADIRFVEDGREVHALRFPVFGGFGGFQALCMADHFIDGAESAFCHDFAHFHGDEGHEVDDVFCLALEVFTEDWILGGDADGAGIFLADAHHDAADGDERCGGEAVFFCAQEGGDGDIAAGLELAVGF